MNTTENKNKKRYVYLDKYLEHKKALEDRMDILGKALFWLGLTVVCSFLISLVNMFYQYR